MEGMLPTPAKQFSFTKDGKFLDNQLSAEITVTAGSDVAAILAANAPFPAGKTTRVGRLSATVGGNTGDLNFASRQGAVSFSGSAAATSALGVYAGAADLVNDLNPDPRKPILQALSMDGSGATQFVLLDWGYAISESATGSVALGAGVSASFGLEGAANGLFAVIRAFPAPPRSRDAIQATITSWKLPSQVGAVEDLDPGTWLIAEVDGSIGVNIGAQYGYEYSWIRKVDLGPLSGDVGLKVQAAVDAVVGFEASGKYLLVLARESVDPASKTVRVRVFKMAKKGWDFAFNANAGVTGSAGQLLPSQLDDFLAAVFGVHGAQIIADLKLFDKWTDPNTPLPDLVSGFVSDFITRELRDVADPEIQKYQAARRKIADFLKQWDKLGHTAATLLWSEVQKAGGPVPDLLNFLRQTNDLDDARLRELIESELGRAGFASSPAGKWLETVAETDVLALLNSAPLLASLRAAAQTALDVANSKVLDELVQFAGRKLNIADVEKIVTEADFNNLDPWLKAKLATFLGKDTVVFADLDKIRAGARAIRGKADQLYAEALKALKHTYTAAFHYSYAKSTTATALLDVSFDFLRNPGLGAYLKMAIQGDFKDLLLAEIAGVALKSGTLTHGVKRQSHVQIVLPYCSGTIDHLNDSLAGMKVVEDKGRLFVYDLQANDTLTRAHKWISNLTITGKLSVGAGVRTFITDQEVAGNMTFAYSFRQAGRNVRDVQLQEHLEPLVAPYFPKVFGGPEAPDTASLHEWIGDLDNHASAVAKTGTGNLGTVLLSLDVSLPGKVVAAWFNAPGDRKAGAYLEMSRAIQRALRRFTQFCHFDDPSKYGDLRSAPSVFVYGCLPVSTNIHVNDDGSITLDRPDEIYWDFKDLNKLSKMVFAAPTKAALALRMAGIRQMLLDSGKFKDKAQFYNPASLDEPLSTALASPSFAGLLFTEAQTVEQARDAGLQMARFRSQSGNDPQPAIRALEEFGAKITEAFNNGLGSLVPRLQEFSAMIFLEAARAFDPDLTGVRPIARLDLMLLKPSAPPGATDQFLNGTAPDATAVSLEQPIVGLP